MVKGILMGKPVTSPGIPTAEFPWHSLTLEEVARRLESDVMQGLTSGQARRHPGSPRPAESSQLTLAFRLLKTQLKGTVILILGTSAIGFWFLGHRGDSIGIGASIVFAVVLGFLTDFRAEKALAMLKSLTEPTARVIRDGLQLEIPSRQVVPGDLVILSAGHLVPGDGRVIQSQSLSINEAMLTGETVPVDKITTVLPEDLTLPDRTNMAFAGTAVVEGQGRIIISGVGPDTELGRIGGLVQKVGKDETPLERQAESLGRRLAILVLILCTVVTAVGLLLGQPLMLMLETGFLLAIAAIPEGLPAVTTVALASGVRRMVRANSLVRRLSAVETLGSVEVICADKTGTMTENCMQIVGLKTLERTLAISGHGYQPTGSFLENGKEIRPLEDPVIRQLLLVGCVCNNAELEDHEGWHIHGSPTEGAILTFAAKSGIDCMSLRSVQRRLKDLPFNSERKRMTAVVEGPDRKILSLVKGTASSLLSRCASVETAKGRRDLTPEERLRLQGEAFNFAQNGSRVLAFAYRNLAADWTLDVAETDLTWLGFVAMTDPLRPGLRNAIDRLRIAGIKTVMLTGDQRETAVAIGRELGLCDDGAEVLDGRDVAPLLERRDWEALNRISIFSRVTPEDKFALVRAFKAAGRTVAMTGDGINDAPALKAADIGIAMGAQAADIAKESSDLVVTDANFATLPAAVEEGRQIYSNLQRAVRFLLLCSFSNILLVFAAVAAKLPIPMLPLQILWLNLVIHIFPGIALAVTPGGEDLMSRPPRRGSEPLLSWKMLGLLAFKGGIIAGAALLVYVRFLDDLPMARTLVMTTLALCLLLQIFPMLSERETFFQNRRFIALPLWLAIAGGLFIQAFGLYWPPMGRLLHSMPLPFSAWTAPVVAAVICLILMEGVKFGIKKVGIGA